MKRNRFSIEDTRNTFAYQYMKVNVSLEEAHAFIGWMIAQGRRLEERRAQE